MINFINAALRNVLQDSAQLAAGCLFPFVANLFTAKGKFIRVQSKAGCFLAITASSFAGMLLPFGAFGVIPVVAAGWMAGLGLPLILPLLVSNFLFNLSMPLTEAVFIWNGNFARIALAFVAGVLSGAFLLHYGKDTDNLLRRSSYDSFFEGHRNETNYFKIFKRYFETAGLFIFAAAVMKAVFSLYAGSWLQGQFHNSDFGMSVDMGISRLNVFNPFFGAVLQLLDRLTDFSALAAFLLLLRIKSAVKLYVFYIVLALSLSVSLWIK